MLEELTFKSLGVVNYHETLDLMKSHIKSNNFKNEIWLLEHPPIFTLGTAADESHILNAKGIPIFQSDRGGEVTQIRDLNKNISKLQLEELVINLLKNIFLQWK